MKIIKKVSKLVRVTLAALPILFMSFWASYNSNVANAKVQDEIEPIQTCVFNGSCCPRMGYAVCTIWGSGCESC